MLKWKKFAIFALGLVVAAGFVAVFIPGEYVTRGLALLGLAVPLAKAGYDIWDKERERAKRPELILSAPPRLFADQRNTQFPDGNVHQCWSRWIRIRVENRRGRKVARNCRAYLVGLKFIDKDAKTLELLHDDWRPLRWMHDTAGRQSRDIVPGAVHQIDLVATSEQSSRIVFQVDPPLGDDKHGKYVFTVHVVAEDAEPKGLEIPVCWSGTYESLNPGDYQPLAL